MSRGRHAALLSLLLWGCKSPEAGSPPKAPAAGADATRPPADPPPADHLDRRALLVGISNYQYDDEGIQDLRGPAYDLETMHALLTEQFAFPEEGVRILRDAEATHDGILRVFREHLINPARANSVVVFYYSGHGSQIADEENGDEISDHLDETLVAYDSGRTRHPNRDLIDDEMNSLFAELETKTKAITAIFDSCHSGSASRGNGVPRFAPVDPRARPRPRGVQDGQSGRPASGHYASLSGSRDSEVSNEGLIDGAIQGAFTWAFNDVVRQRGAGVTYRDVMEEVGERVNRKFALQHPHLEGAGMDHLVFGTESRVLPKYHLVRLKGEQYEVYGGAVHGLAVGSELEVYPPGDAELRPGAGLARLRLQEVGAVRARAKCIEACTIADSSRAVERLRPAIKAAIKVWIDPHLAQAAELARKLADYPIVSVTERIEEYVLRVAAREGRVEVSDGSGYAAGEGVPQSSPTLVPEVLERVLHWAKWASVAQIENKASDLKVKLFVSGNSSAATGGEQRGAVFRVGDTLSVTAINESNQKLFLYLLAIGSDGEVAVLYPAPGVKESIAPQGRWEKQGLRATWSEGWKHPELRNQVKLIASTKPTDLSFLAQPPFMAGEMSTLRGDLDALETVMRVSVGSRGGLSASEVPKVSLDSWVTTDVSVTTVP